MMIEYLDHHKNKNLSDLYANIKTSYQSPTMAPYCKDEDKYKVVDEITEKIIQDQNNKNEISGCKIVNTNIINGIRFSLSNGSWGLVRASNTQPVIVCRFEGDTLERMNEIKSIVLEKLQEFGTLNISAY